MNNNLLFLCLALGVLILSAVTIGVAPLINGVHSHFNNWGTKNCQKKKDEYDYNENKNFYPTDKDKKYAKKKVNECYNHNAMHDLEYTSFIMDIVFGFICSTLGILHYFDVGKSIEKISGLIGLITGAIIAVITCIYVGYSASIFNNDSLDIDKLYPNKAYFQWKDEEYRPNYDESKLSDDPDIVYAKFRDLGKKQYNYDSDFYKSLQDPNSEVNNCYGSKTMTRTSIRSYSNNANLKCEYIWLGNVGNNSIEYKYAYDRWLTTIILSVFIVVCGLGLAVFGFLLFKNSGNSISGKVPVN